MRQTISTLVIRLILALFLLAILLFALAIIFQHISLTIFANKLIQLGSHLIIGAVSALCIYFSIGVIAYSIKATHFYFSAEQRALRQYYYSQIRQLGLIRLFSEQLRYIQYYHEQNRQRLNQHDDKRQLNLLCLIIKQQLKRQRAILNKPEFKQLQKRYRVCYEQRNIQGLLELQQELQHLNARNPK